MNEDTRTLAKLMLGAVDTMLVDVLDNDDVPAAVRTLSGLTRREMGLFLGALAFRVVDESGVPPCNWSLRTDHGMSEDDPGLAALRLIVAAGNADHGMLVAMVEVLMNRGLFVVGLTVRAMIIAVREARELRGVA